MFEPEFYLSYRVRSLEDGSLRTVSGKYRDTMACGPWKEPVLEEQGNAMEMFAQPGTLLSP